MLTLISASEARSIAPGFRRNLEERFYPKGLLTGLRKFLNLLQLAVNADANLPDRVTVTATHIRGKSQKDATLLFFLQAELSPGQLTSRTPYQAVLSEAEVRALLHSIRDNERNRIRGTQIDINPIFVQVVDDRALSFKVELRT